LSRVPEARVKVYNQGEMPRLLLALLLLPLAAAADGRSDFVAARDALNARDFESLPPEERDRLFQQLGSHDATEAVRPIADIASRYGTYLSGLEAQMEALQEKLRKVNDRQALSDDEIALRATWERSLQKLETQWRAGQASLEVLMMVLGRFREWSTLQVALGTLEKHPTWRVRYLLAGACGIWHESLREEKVSKAVLATLKRLKTDDEPRVRAGVARGLASIRREEALEVLKVYLKDPDWRVRAAAVKSLALTRSEEVVTILIEAMKGEEGRLRDDINAVLKQMTGESLGFADVWERWWDGVGRKLPDPNAKKTEGGQEAVAREREGHRFYGIETRSNRILFIIDVSGSMLHPVDPLKQKPVITGRKEAGDEPAPGRTRFEVAQNELRRAVENLSPKAEFSMIFFSHAVQVWNREMVRATAEGKKQALAAIDSLRAAGATFTLGALREGFAMAGVTGAQPKTGKAGAKIDTIFLLSDGAPTDSKFDNAELMDPQIILDAVREWNKDAHVTIHTIAVDILDNYFLRTLAAENGGQFVERKG